MSTLLDPIGILLPDLSLTAFLVVSLAAARITRVITTDSISDPFRLFVSDRVQSDWVDTLLSCPWCMGFWVSLATVLVVANFPTNPLVLIFVAAFATSQVVGIIATMVTFFTKDA